MNAALPLNHHRAAIEEFSVRMVQRPDLFVVSWTREASARARGPSSIEGPRRLKPPSVYDTLDGSASFPAAVPGCRLADLFIVADGAAQISNPGHKRQLRRGLAVAGPGENVTHLRYFPFRLLGGIIEVFTVVFSCGVVDGAFVLSKEGFGISIRKRVDLAVSGIEAKRVEVSIQKTALSLSNHVQSFRLIGFHGCNRFLQHRLSLSSRPLRCRLSKGG